MPQARNRGRLFGYAGCVVLFAGLGTPAASAGLLRLTMTGQFGDQDALNLAGVSPPGYFSPATPFSVAAVFDTDGPSTAPPIPGFVAYSPVSAYLTVGGQTYRFVTTAEDQVNGVSVAVFDKTNFFTPGRYGVGLLQNPPADGAGFIGDWLSAAPDVTVGNLVPTTFTDYAGVGFGSGPPLDPQNPLGPKFVVPIRLVGGDGKDYLLTLGNSVSDLDRGGPLFTARLTAVPEPASLALLAAGAGGFGLIARRRARS